MRLRGSAWYIQRKVIDGEVGVRCHRGLAVGTEKKPSRDRKIWRNSISLRPGARRAARQTLDQVCRVVVAAEMGRKSTKMKMPPPTEPSHHFMGTRNLGLCTTQTISEFHGQKVANGSSGWSATRIKSRTKNQSNAQNNHSSKCNICRIIDHDETPLKFNVTVYPSPFININLKVYNIAHYAILEILKCKYSPSIG